MGTTTDHPLLRPFPLVVMALAVTLVLFALMMARLTGGEDSPGKGSPHLLLARAPTGSALARHTSRASSAAARTLASHPLAARGAAGEQAGEDGASVAAG